MEFLLRGIILGFSIAAPVGPIGVLCIRRTLSNGRISGFVSGLGAATADAIYASIAGFGMTFVSSALVSQQGGLRFVGGVFLCYLGIKTFVGKPAVDSDTANEKGLASAYVSTFFLTLTNPLTILSFAAIFAGLGVLNSNYFSAATLVVGVFLGSLLWWFLLSSGVGLVRSRFDLRAMRWVSWLSGSVIVGFGLFALASLVKL